MAIPSAGTRLLIETVKVEILTDALERVARELVRRDRDTAPLWRELDFAHRNWRAGRAVRALLAAEPNIEVDMGQIAGPRDATYLLEEVFKRVGGKIGL